MLNALAAGLGVPMIVYWLLLQIGPLDPQAESRIQGRELLPEFPWQYLIGGAAVLATAGGFGMAVRRGLIGWPTCGIATAGWLTLCGLAGSLSLLLSSLEPAPLVFMAGLLALPMAPLAAAPLALSWNRHR